LSEASALSDRAVKADPTNRQAAFNRALILEVANPPAAGEAWQTYLAMDSGSEWAAEARNHLEALKATRR
jgi:hypothetical protein